MRHLRFGIRPEESLLTHWCTGAGPARNDIRFQFALWIKDTVRRRRLVKLAPCYWCSPDNAALPRNKSCAPAGHGFLERVLNGFHSPSGHASTSQNFNINENSIQGNDPSKFSHQLFPYEYVLLFKYYAVLPHWEYFHSYKKRQDYIN